MGKNNNKYLDYAGLEKLVDLHAVVPHPQATEHAEGAYKISYDEHGHIVSSSALTPADLGLETALHFRGESTTDPLSATGATVTTEPIGTFTAGDVVIYKRTATAGDNGQGNYFDDDPNANVTELYYEEYIYTGVKWELLGDASSYALKDVTISSDGTYITGGGNLSANRKLSHKTYTAQAAAIRAIGRDSGGHVVLGNEITVQSGGGSSHDHTTSTTIAANTYVTGVGHSDTSLSISPTKAAVIKEIPGNFANLDTTSITGVSGSTTASKATAGTAVSVAKAGDAVVYGKANVGTAVTGLAKRAASATTVGNANVATSATTVGNADVGAATVYGKANVGTAITVQDGKADVGAAVVYGTANVGTAVSVATQATSQTKVGNADVGSAVTYGTADVGTAVVYGTADVGDSKTVATRATSQTTVGNANIASSATTVGNANVGTAVSVLNSFSNTARTSGSSVDTDLFHAAVDEDEETLVLTPRIVTTGNTSITPASQSTTSIYGAVASETKIYGVGGTTTVTSAKAAPSTQTLTPAVASTKTLTPAKAVSDSSTKIYGVGSTVSITPAVAAPTSQTLTPAVASGRTKSIAPAVAAPSTQTLTPAVASTTTIYGAVESDTTIYGVTADQVSIAPAVAAPSTQTIVPAIANGTITPYTFSNVTVPKAASAKTVATGTVSVGGAGSAVMTGTGEVVTEDVMTAATIVEGTTGDVTVVKDVTQTKNSAKTFTGTTDEHTCPAHTHTLATA